MLTDGTYNIRKDKRAKPYFLKQVSIIIFLENGVKKAAFEHIPNFLSLQTSFHFYFIFFPIFIHSKQGVKEYDALHTGIQARRQKKSRKERSNLKEVWMGMRAVSSKRGLDKQFF